MPRIAIKRDLLESLQARILKDALKNALDSKTKSKTQQTQEQFIWDSLLFFSV